MTSVLGEKRKREKDHVKMKADVEVVQPQSRNIWSHQKLEKTGRSLSQSLQEGCHHDFSSL